MTGHLSAFDRVAYTASQAARFGWFYSQYRRAQRRASPAVRKDEAPDDGPSTAELLAALFAAATCGTSSADSMRCHPICGRVPIACSR